MFKGVGLFKGLFIILQIVGWAGLVCAYLAPYVNPAAHWVPAFAGLAHLWIVLANIFLAALALMVNRFWFIAALVILVAGTPIHKRNLAMGSTSTITSESITVLSWNIQLFKLYNYNQNKQNRADILAEIAQQQASVACLQEFYYQPSDKMSSQDGLIQIDDPAYYHFEPGVVKEGNRQYGIATFSKYPIVKKGKVQFSSRSNRTNMCIYSDLDLIHDTVRVYNVQLASNHLNTKEVDSILGGGDRRWQFSMNWLKKLRNGYDLRSEQVGTIATHIAQSPHPVIVCGDFNDVPVSYTYQQVYTILNDCFLEAGTGLGATYNGKIPNLRIDYIFCAPQFKVHQFQVLAQGLTDHFPIVTHLSL